ncbi:hypothetical protein STENM327S_01957 [Streptomyces tendae]
MRSGTSAYEPSLRPRQWKVRPPGRCPRAIHGTHGDIRVHDMVAGTLGAGPSRSARWAKNWKSSRARYVSPAEWRGYWATGRGEG